MNWVIGAIVLCVFSIIIVTLAMFVTLRKLTLDNDSSKYIVNRFEPDNTAPKITEMIEFHKSNGKVEYKIERK